MKAHLVVRTALLWAAAQLCLTPAAACGSSTAARDSQEVEIFSWWTAGGEANALRNLLSLFKRDHPDQVVIDAAATGSTNARATLKNRMIGGQPPDTFQANGGWDLLAWVLYNGRNENDSKMEPLDALAAAQHWAMVIPGAVLDSVSFGGHPYAVPLNIHRVNSLFFNPGVFAKAGVLVPTSLDELFSTAAILQAQGITPLALGTNDPWTLTLLLFENLLVARAGGAYYRDFFLGRGDALAPAIRGAVDDLGRLLAFTNVDAGQLDWSQAVERVRTGQAAMTIMGDWAKGYFVAKGGVPDVSFGQVAMPGTEGTFVFTTDTFGLPKGARNRQGALDLLRLFGSKPGQDTFNPTKGSIPARGDADTGAYDVMSQRTIADFRRAAPVPDALVPATAILARPDFVDAMKLVLKSFVVERNSSVVVHTLKNWYDVLQANPWQ